jgi:hypothetical protein
MGTRFDALDSGLHKVEVAVIDHIDTSQREVLSAQQLEHNRSRLLASLSFSGMNERIASIPSHTETTFDWILDPFCEDAAGSFASWLLSTEPHFWIRGKAGSGKSTLMKRLWTDDYVVKLLRIKSGESAEVIVVKHSFWLSTTNELRKNYKGMLCSLVHGILSSSTTALDWLWSEYPNSRNMKECSDWDETELESTLFALLDNRLLCGSVCVFLDALDEIGNPFDQRKILKFVQRLCLLCNAPIKICTSSRPERPWSDIFSTISQLRLEDLTFRDIEAYARQELGEEPFVNTAPYREDAGRSFAKIAQKAEGVFLWAHLAVQSLLRASAHASWQEITAIVNQLPRGIMQLYSNILSRRADDNAAVKAEAATYLRMCLQGRDEASGLILHQALPIWRGHFRREGNYLSQTDAIKHRVDLASLEERITDVCGGLVRPLHCENLITWPYPSYPNDTSVDDESPLLIDFADLDAVDFEVSHRTVFDFLTDVPEGTAFTDLGSVADWQVLHGRIDGELLRYRIYHERSLFHRRYAFPSVIVRFMELIAGFVRKHKGERAELWALQAVERLMKGLVNDSSVSSELSQDSLSTLVFKLAQCSETTSWGDTISSPARAYDIEGLLLEYGIDLWFYHTQRKNLHVQSPGTHAWTTAYKDYLLLCATWGNLTNVASCLVDSGANLYAEHHLPIWNPNKQTAASEFLARVASDSWVSWKFTTDDLHLWSKFVASCSPTHQYTLLYIEPLLAEGMDTQHFVKGPNSRSSPALGPLDVSAIFSLDVHATVCLWLSHAVASLLPSAVPDTFFGFMLLADDSKTA